ncbi:antiviral RADAR system adenosine deaminase RdrB [Massilia sp. W12]|uniref:antiviral RADAR system adenosine deaminase RdrB n=1 Tax=Massilia sp. W12 TaxID=3126507 RepID=UPI0030CE4064
MLTRSLHEVAIGTLFTSTRVSEKLRAYLATYPFDDDEQTIAGFVRNCRTQLEKDLDQDHARRFRLGDIEKVMKALWGKDLFSSVELPILEELFTRLMERNGDFVQYQVAQVQAYARLCAEIDPGMLVAWHLVSWLERANPLPDDVRRVIQHQQPFFAPPSSVHKPYAEGHVHLGGIRSDLLILGENIFCSGTAEEQEIFLRLRHIRQLIGILLNPQDTELRVKLCQTCAIPSNFIDPFDTHDWESVRESCIVQHGIVDANWLRWQLAQAVIGGELARAMLWLNVYLWFLYRQKQSPPALRIAIFYLMASMMQIRRGLIMDGQGLSRFVRTYFNAELRKKHTQHGSADMMRALMTNATDLAEIKITPDSFNANKAAEVAKDACNRHDFPVPLLSWLTPTAALQPKDIAYLHYLEQWHFCAHFLRQEETAKSRKDLWKKAIKFQKTLYSESAWNDDVFLGGHTNPAFHFQPANWLRGLDIAGDENIIRNDIFAPILRWLRRGFLPRNTDTRATANFHFSIHVGEDYAHPLSGMRQIDETVRFCEMRSGDRLGHALAIGIPPAQWVARHGDMVLPVDEHLDNLVWAWHYASELSARIPLASHVIPLLERRIARFVDHIPWLNSQYQLSLYLPIDVEASRPSSSVKFHIAPSTLHQAWQLRRNCYYQFKNNQTAPFYGELLDSAVPDFAKLKQAEDGAITLHNQVEQRSEQGSAARIYLDREQLRLEYKEKMRNVLVRVADAKDWARREHAENGHPAFLYDYETPEELSFMHALQDYLLDQYDRQGLIIETNPSSNVYIARMENHAEHPIFRWNPPHEKNLEDGGVHNQFGLRRGPIRVLINTDDPGIMPTTLRTEFALLQEAAIDLGYSRSVSEIWLERLRQFGIEEFQRKHQPIFSKTE